MVLVIVFAYIFCWSPYFIITAITQVHYNFFDRGQFFFTMLIINLLAFTHSCVNPIVYFSMSARFRKVSSEQYNFYKNNINNCVVLILQMGTKNVSYI